MERSNDILTQEIVKELFDYDLETGELIWKPRDIKWFPDNGEQSPEWRQKRWNSKNSGKIAFTSNSLQHGYRYNTGNIFGKKYRKHRILWLLKYGEWPKNHLDHQDHDVENNKIDNLKDSTNIENGRNCKLNSDNKSGVMGVHFDKSRNKWVSRIKVNYKTIFLGRFLSFDEAVKVRKEAERKYGFHENHGKTK